MKKITAYLLLSIVIIGCSSDKKSQKEIAFINASKKYPEKEINLTDIADIRYVYLHSKTDDYLFKGRIEYVTENGIVVIDRSSQSILFFSKDGNPVSRFNRRGQGPEEYTDAVSVMYDETNDELFVSPDFSDHIMVYSSTGEFKRKINLPQANVNGQMVLFDDVSILVYDNTKLWRSIMQGNLATTAIDSTFFLISKADGTLLRYIPIPNKNIDLSYKDLGGDFIGQVSYGRVRKSPDGFLLYNPETDTIFHYGKDNTLTPYLYKRPLLSESNPMTVMDICMDAGNYQFISLYSYGETGTSPSPQYYMRNKDTGEIYRQKLTLPDYRDKYFFVNPRLSNYSEKGCYFELDFTELEEAYRKNKLAGELKELVASLLEEEDSNNVFMLADFY